MKIVPLSVSFESRTPNAERVIERAARTCYLSEPKGDRAKFLASLLRRGHLSVFEHASASFRIVANRGVSHEFVRHRLASYSQESTRYCDYGGEGIAVVKPPGLDRDRRIFGVWKQAMLDVESAYQELRTRGVPPQIARSVLPICTKSEFVATANLRTWLWFIRLRTAKAAHPEMRVVASEILRLLRERIPEVFGPPVAFVPGGELWTPTTP